MNVGTVHRTFFHPSVLLYHVKRVEFRQTLCVFDNSATLLRLNPAYTLTHARRLSVHTDTTIQGLERTNLCKLVCPTACQVLPFKV